MSGIPVDGAPDRPQDNFVMVANENVRNALPTPLTGLALALHHYLLSILPGRAVGDIDSIADRVFPLDSRDAVRRAGRELMNAGLMILHTSRGDRGQFVKRYQVFHNPQPVENRTPSKSQIYTRETEKRREARRRSASGSPDQAKQEFPQVAPDAGTPAAGRPAAGVPADKDLKTKDRKTKEDRSARAREGDPPVDNPDSMTDMIISEIKNRTKVKITRDHAQLVALQIIGRASSAPDYPIPFVRTAIRREDDPRNFLPTYTPPNARDGMWDRAWARAKARESATDRACADAQAVKATLKHRPYQNPEDDSVYDLDFWGQPIPGTPTYEREHREPASLGQGIAGLFGTPAEAEARQASMTPYQRETSAPWISGTINQEDQ